MEQIIVNPAAGRGFAAEAARRLDEWMDKMGIEHAMHRTGGAGHARELAGNLADSGAACIWALGGDATLNETAQGLHGKDVPLGVMPCGTGNDLCRVLGVPARDPINAYVRQQGGIREIDLWMANEDVFLNVAGIGFDVETLVQARRFRRLPGSMLPYLLGVLVTVLTHKSEKLTLSIDGQAYDGGFLMLSMANGQYIGGGMRVAPQADAADGLLDVVMIRPTSRPRIPFLLPKFLRGDHIGLDITTLVRGREILIQSDRDTYYQADGELFAFRTLHVRPSPNKLLLRALTPMHAQGEA